MGAGVTYAADFVYGPVHITSAVITPPVAAPRAEQLIVSTAGARATHETPMTVGAFVTLSAAPGDADGSGDIYFICSNRRFGATAPAAHDAAHPWRILQAGQQFNYIAETITDQVWITSVDGSTTVQANIAVSSPIGR